MEMVCLKLDDQILPGTFVFALDDNVTDNDSVKMLGSHGFVQGYNGISIVDEKHQVVVYPEVFGTVGEGSKLIEVMRKAKIAARRSGITDNIFESGKVICDTNYFSEKNCKYLDINNIDGYIPDQYFRQRDPRFPDKYERRKKKNLFTQEDFIYDKKRDDYICPNNKILKADGKNIKYHKYRGNRYKVKTNDCERCLNKAKCLKSGAKRRQLFFVTEYPDRTYSNKMIEKIDTEYARNIYSQRMGIIESVFGNITYHKRLIVLH